MMTDDMANSTRETGAILGRSIAAAPQNYYKAKDQSQRYRMSEKEEGRRMAEEQRAQERYGRTSEAERMELERKRREDEYLNEVVDDKTGMTRYQQQQQMDFKNKQLQQQLYNQQLASGKQRSELDAYQLQKLKASDKMSSLANRFLAAGDDLGRQNQLAQEARQQGYSEAQIEGAMFQASQKQQQTQYLKRLQNPQAQVLAVKATELMDEVDDISNARLALQKYEEGTGGPTVSKISETAETDFARAIGKDPSEMRSFGNFSAYAKDYQRELELKEMKVRDQIADLERQARVNNDPVLLQNVQVLKAQLDDPAPQKTADGKTKNNMKMPGPGMMGVDSQTAVQRATAGQNVQQQQPQMPNAAPAQAGGQYGGGNSPYNPRNINPQGGW